MSVKSLLQLILFLLIILVIGGIYFLYFYESPKLNVKLKPIIEKNDYNQDSSVNDISEREILEEVEIRDKNNAIQSNKNLNTESIKIENDLKKGDKHSKQTGDFCKIFVISGVLNLMINQENLVFIMMY